MTTIAGAGPTLTQHLYQRLFDRLNTDGDDALSVVEVDAAQAGGVDSASVFKNLDADGDGRVMQAEMVPSAAFAADTLRSLVGTQTEGSVNPKDEEILAALFARADLDRDGALSVEEMDAEKAIRRAATLDAGYISGPVLVPRDENGDGLLTPDEIRVGHMLPMRDTVPAVLFHDELPEEDQRRMADFRERLGLPPLPVLTAEEKQRQRDQDAADWAELRSGPEGSVKFLARDIGALREQVRADFSAANMSQTLTARLLQQIAEGWARAADISA